MDEQEKMDVATIFQVFSELPEQQQAYFLGFVDGVEAGKRKAEPQPA